MILLGVLVPDELAVIAAENNGGTIYLVLEDVLVVAHLFATALPIATLEFNFRQEVPRDAVHLIKLGVAAAKRTVIGVFCKPVALAIRAYRFFADFAFQGILQNIVAHSAN